MLCHRFDCSMSTLCRTDIDEMSTLVSAKANIKIQLVVSVSNVKVNCKLNLPWTTLAVVACGCIIRVQTERNPRLLS